MCEKCNHNLEGKYEPHDFEDEIYKNWEEKGYFKPSGDKTKESYCIMMPPSYGTCTRWNFARYIN